MDQILSVLFYQPIVNLLLLLYKVLFENLGIAVIAITILLRAILWPLYKKQLEGQERMKKIQPKIRALQEQKKKPADYSKEEKEMLAESSRAFGAGCLPVLIQLPFLFALYAVISNIVSDKAYKISELAYFDFLKFPADYKYHTSFLGVDLSQIPSNIGFGNLVQLWPFIIIIALVAVTQWYSIKLMSPAPAPIEEPKNNKKKNAKEPEKKEPNPEEMQRMISQQTTIILPVLFIFMSWSFAAILSVYIIMGNILSIFQTLVTNKKINLKPWKTLEKAPEKK